MPVQMNNLRTHPCFTVSPRSVDRATDRRMMASKLEQADFAITQFSFLPDEQVRLRDELAALGCTTPVIPSGMEKRRMSSMKATRTPIPSDAAAP